jgi:phytoene dehydrogenase-like protein
MEVLVATAPDPAETPNLPEGKRLLSLYTLSPYSRSDAWNAPLETRPNAEYRTLEEYTELRDELADMLIEQAETLFPGLTDSVEERHVLTPLSLERLTGNTGGAAFGWANIPEQCGSHRQGPRTPLRGLYLASHWTFPGGSLAAAATAGRAAAHLVLAER